MSGATKLTHVHTPIQIGPVTIRNRVVRTAHQTRLPQGGGVSEKLIAYHEERAIGGVGLTIIETMGIHPCGPGTLNVFHPDMPTEYPRMMERLKKHGMTVFQQLWHAGHNITPIDGSPPWSVSDKHSYIYPIVPIKMTKSMIDEVIEAYANTARSCETWGADGAEVHAAHGYLPAQFLSPALNDRDDEYGGSLENRARFLLEVLEAVRASVSKNFAICVRLGHEDLPGLIEYNELHQVAQWIEERGLTDVFNISLGNYQKLGRVVPPMHEPLGYQLPTSMPVREGLKTPVILIGRVRTLEEADAWIRAGDCDMVGLNRATIADPELVNKTLAGHPEQVRPCIACNQACVGGEFMTDTGNIGCAVNPGAGRELFLGDHKLTPVETPRKVLVVGGGPAGMEAARVAALRGHKVTLVEAQPRLGGTINLAAMAPTRAGIRDITVWQEDEIFRLGVEVQLSTYVDTDDIAAMEPDTVILATGSTPRLDGVQVSNPGQPTIGMDQPHVISSNGLFEGERRELGNSAVVIDDVGHVEGIATAEYLVSKGLKVTLVTQQPMFGMRTEKFLINDAALQRLYRGDFSYHTRTRAVEITKDSVVIAPVFGPDNANTIHTLPADTVIFISLNKANREMYEELKDRGIEVRVVGDAEDPRFLAYATLRGHKAGAAV